MIRGMSYPKGIFYMDEDHIAHATVDTDGQIATVLFEFGPAGLWFFLRRIVITTPVYFSLGMMALAAWASLRPGVPIYWLIAAAFGYHFIFPYPLRQFHGAEHKVFSFKGPVTLKNLEQIAKADIVNQSCSTNGVVLFFLFFLAAWYPLGGNMAALLGILGSMLVPRLFRSFHERWLFPLSAFLQKKVTTVPPEPPHLKTAVLSYVSLIRKRAVTEEMLLKEWEEEEAKRLEEEKEQMEKLKEMETEKRLDETEWVEI